jgi:serine/threonine protein kinase
LRTKTKKKIWHRDIKPGNLLLASKAAGASEVLQVADLGSSRTAQVSSGTQPTSIGTRDYMAPEQDDPALAPADGCWAKADVWSAGVTLLEMVGGGWHECVLLAGLSGQLPGMPVNRLDGWLLAAGCSIVLEAVHQTGRAARNHPGTDNAPALNVQACMHCGR